MNTPYNTSIKYNLNTPCTSFRRLARDISIKMSAVAWFTISILCAQSSSAIANNQPAELEEVIIEASRIPSSLARLPYSAQTVSGRKVQLAQPQLGLDEALIAVPGLFLQNRTNFAQDLRISIRGFGARASFGIRGVRIFVDGIPETLPDGQGGIDGIDLSSIGQIEVLRGPASSLYGNASGGIINITTEFDHPQPFIEGRTAFGGDGYSKQQLKLGGSSDRFDYLGSFSHLEIDGYREHSQHRNTSYNSRFRYRFENDATLNVSISGTDQPIANDPGGINLDDLQADRRSARPKNVTLNAGEAINQKRIGARLIMPISERSQITARSYLVNRKFLGRIPVGRTGPGVGSPDVDNPNNGTIAFDRQFFGGGLTYQHQSGNVNSSPNESEKSLLNPTSRPRNVLLIGIDYDRQDDDRQRFENNFGLTGDKMLDQNELVTSVGWFIQDRYSVNDNWDITAGARYDEVEFDVTDNFGDNSGARTLSELSPSLGTLFHISPALNLFANFSTAFETPTTTELAVPATTGINFELDPQRSKSIEVGIKGTISNGMSYSAAIFDIEVKDEIVGFETPAGDDVFVNAAKSDRYGFELQISLPLGKQFSSALAYTYSDFSFDEFIDDEGDDLSNNDIPGLPENTVHWQLDYAKEVNQRTALAFTFESLYVDSFVLNNANTANTDSYIESNIRGAVTIKLNPITIEPFIGVTNLFNKNHVSNARINAFGGRFFEAAPDRNLYGGLTLRYQPEAN